MEDNVIQNDSQLAARPDQLAIFLKEGIIADVFDEGTHKLETKNLQS
ncbi:SPFH domain-containing protein [Bacillus sp. N9]